MVELGTALFHSNLKLMGINNILSQVSFWVHLVEPVKLETEESFEDKKKCLFLPLKLLRR